MQFRFMLCATLICTSLTIGLTNESSATDAGRWTIDGTLINVDDELENTIRCPKANVRLRFRSRWIKETATGNEFPWGATWGQTNTDSQGRFSKQSHPFANKKRKRDVLIEFRKFDEWQTLQIIENLDGSVPHQTTGNHWVFQVGEIETDAFDCPFQGTGATEVDRQPRLETNRKTFAGSGKPGIDFEIVQSVVRHRTLNDFDYPPGRIEWEVTVRNNGTVDYSGTGEQLTDVRITLFRGSSQPTFSVLMSEPIAAGESKVFFSPSGGNFGQTENLLPNYNVLFSVDPDAKVKESNEGNNDQPGCYSPLTEEYNEGNCNESRSGKSFLPRQVP